MSTVEEAYVGVVTVEEALARARALKLDLLIIDHSEDPPIAQIMEYSQYKFLLDKNSRRSRKKHPQAEQK